MAATATRGVSYAEYLEIERAADIRHEYRDGYVVAMAGGTPPHAAPDLGMNAGIALGNALRGRPCRPSNSDQEIRIPSLDLATYPDISVFCGERVADELDPDALTNPTLVLEVLSPSTEGYDRGEKFGYYRAIPTLRQYVLVSATQVRVEVFTRNEDESWTLRTYGQGEVAAFGSIDVGLPVDEVYAGVELEPRSPSRTA